MFKKVMLIIIIVMVLLLGCSSPTEPFISVKYEITGAATSTAFVTYENSGGGTNQADITMPWEYVFSAKSGTWVYVSAQNSNSAGTITVKIYKDGSLFKKSVSVGAYVIATASGTI